MATTRPQIWADPTWDAQGGGAGVPFLPIAQQGPAVFAAGPTDDAPPELAKVGMTSPTPSVFAREPDRPNVTKEPTPMEAQIGETSNRLKKLQYQDANPYGSANNHPGVGGKILHALSVAGNIAGDIFAPATTSLIPGTQANRQLQEGNLTSRLQELTKTNAENENQEANTDYTKQRPAIEANRVRQHLLTALAPKGFSVTENPFSPGGFDIDEDPQSQGFKDRVALSTMHQATADKDNIMAEIAQNHYQPGTPEYAEAQRKLAQVDKRLQVAVEGLGLRREGLQLRKQNTAANLYGTDLDGNALPGATIETDDEGNQRTVGAQNAGRVIKQQGAVGSFKDLSGSLKHTRATLQDFFNEGNSLSDPIMAAAMSDPHKLTDQIIHGWVESGLTASQVKSLTALKQFQEQAGILRKATAGGAAEAAAQRILDTTPKPGDSNDVVLSKMEEAQNVLDRLTPGVSTVSGGLTVSGKGSHKAAGPGAGQQAFTDGGVTYHIPTDQVAAFMKDHPNAR